MLAYNQNSVPVNFYNGTFRNFHNLTKKDADGLYYLTDGMGIYKGDQRIAGPAPVNVWLTVTSSNVILDSENVSIFQDEGTLGMDNDEEFSDLVELYNDYLEAESRPASVFDNKTGRSIMMYCTNVQDNELTFETSYITLSVDADNENTSMSLYQVKIVVYKDNSKLKFTRTTTSAIIDPTHQGILSTIDELRNSIEELGTNPGTQTTANIQWKPLSQG